MRPFKSDSRFEAGCDLKGKKERKKEYIERKKRDCKGRERINRMD